MSKWINEAPWDRIVRVVVGIILVVLALAGVVTGALAWVFGIVGAVLAITGAAGFCPIYAVLKLSTKKK
jgi:hypothetical protein